MKKLLIILVLLLSGCSANEQGSLDVMFCPLEDCESRIVSLINNSSDVKCAFYELESENLESALKEKNADVLIEEDNYNGYGKKIYSRGIMHNKFCVFDKKKVFTGSYNPTNGSRINPNNIVIIESKSMANNYLKEFEEIKNYGNKKTWKTKIIINNITVENYFCPEDGC